jgi:hypothetical protein
MTVKEIPMGYWKPRGIQRDMGGFPAIPRQRSLLGIFAVLSRQPEGVSADHSLARSGAGFFHETGPFLREDPSHALGDPLDFFPTAGCHGHKRNSLDPDAVFQRRRQG